ncbi:MAG: hypothetical protein Q8S73_13495 [Deltaproteobacteria bacterium]|nr:hypothetical protein [Myxococcales bacterium]MDP3215115.1 hypothetical protein [Deltaproteobacteria bacterium]
MTDPLHTGPEGPALRAFALEKLTRVLGAEKGRRVFADVLSEAKLPDVSTPDDLYVFSECLSRRGGFEAAVGGLLGVAAVLRGATARSAVA